VHRAGLYLLVSCVWLIVLAAMLYLVAKPVRDPSLDFFSYYIGASAIDQGMPLYARETHDSLAGAWGLQMAAGYPYPPTLAVLLQPFVLVPPYVASLLWLGVNVVLLVMAVGLLFKQSDLRHAGSRVALLLLPVLFTPVLMNLYLGNVNLLLLVLIILAYLAFMRGRPLASGVFLALAVWIKLWPATLIAYFAWKREWKAVGGALIGLLLVGLVTIAVAGAGQTASYFTSRLPQIAHGRYPGLDHLNQSVPGVFAKLFSPSSQYVRPLIQSHTLAVQGSRLTTLLIIVTTVLVSSWPIALKGRDQFATEFILVVIATMLIIGRLWDTSLALLLPAYYFLAQEWERGPNARWKQVALPVASIALIDIHRVLWTFANPDKQAWPGILLISPFLGLMLMWLLFVAKRVREVRSLKGGDLGESVEPDAVRDLRTPAIS
jgi:hypothetical protein